MTTVSIPHRTNNHKSKRPDSGPNIAGRAVYSGCERAGSYRWALGCFIAVDRRGNLLGHYATETEAVEIHPRGRPMSERACLPIYPGRSWRLYINSRSTGITVWPDHRHPSMWRIHAAGRVSDIVNLSRAKDAAVTWARPRGLGGTEMARWHYRETPAEAPHIAPNDAPYVRSPSSSFGASLQAVSST